MATAIAATYGANSIAPNIIFAREDTHPRIRIETALKRQARDWADRWPSDPFAYARALKNLRRGLPIETN